MIRFRVPPLSDWPIRVKLIGAIMTVAIVMLFAMAVGFTLYDGISSRRSMVQQIRLLARVIGENSKAALLFKNREDATERLRSLSESPDIATAVLYFSDGQILSEYARLGMALNIPLSLPDQSEARFDMDGLHLFQPVTVEGQAVGIIYINAQTTTLDKRTQELWLVCGALLGLSLLGSILLSLAIQGFITAPIVRLATITQNIRKNRSYAIRARKESNDEVGKLIESFNAMLSEIEARDNDLLTYQQKLEAKVLELRRAEVELRTYTRKLESSNKELQEFAYIASHDLQEPLRKVQSFSDRLVTACGPDLNEKAKDSIERILSATRRMRNLIDDLLSFTRVTSKAKPFAPVNLNTVLHDVKNDLEVAIKEHDANVEVNTLPEIDADASQMWQLFQNLINNSIKFRRIGVTPHIRVTAEPIAPTVTGASKSWRIKVSDNGIGFDNTYKDRLFKVFQRLHTRGEYEGTGIGLAVCRKIVERHGGTIDADGREGQGATFVIELPERQEQTIGKEDA